MTVQVLFTPKDPNPYQETLRRLLVRDDVQVRYLPQPTVSQTANVVITPLSVARAARGGAQILHIHWVYGFALPGSRRLDAVGRLARGIFAATLRTATRSGMKVVWTAHNILPHEPVFDDDIAARRLLAATASMVICHNESTRRELIDRGWVDHRRATVIEIGRTTATDGNNITPPTTRTPARRGRVVGMVGRIEEYKQPVELVRAVEALHRDGQWPDGARLHIEGECRDPRLAATLRQAADRCPAIDLRLERMSDAGFDTAVSSLDAMILPFRAISTSGSAIAGLQAGVPVVLPRAISLAELPDEAVIRFDDLRAGVHDVLHMSEAHLRQRGLAARAWAGGWTWQDMADRTAQVYRTCLA